MTEPTGSAKEAFPRSGGLRLPGLISKPGRICNRLKELAETRLNVAHAVPMLTPWDLVARPVGAMGLCLISEIF